MSAAIHTHQIEAFVEEKPMTSDFKPTVEHLLQLTLFRGEDTQLIEWIIETCPVRFLAQGDMLLKPNQKNNELYIVLEGRLKIELERNGAPTLTYVEAGGCVGELSVIEGEPTTAFVFADHNSYLLCIHEKNLWSLINKSHVVSKNLLRLLSSRVRKDDDVITESLHLQRDFEQQSKIDALTGLYNRRWLDEALERWTARNRSLSLMMLDIDHFKKYNDTQGHLAGDSVLHTVASTILGQLRPSDLAARYGGEEFVALLPDATREEATHIAERVCKAIRQQELKYNDGRALPGVTISIGIAQMTNGQDKNSLLAAADEALYRAKSSGRDCVSH